MLSFGIWRRNLTTIKKIKDKKMKYKLISFDGEIVEECNSIYSALNFKSWYYKLCGEYLEIKNSEKEENSNEINLLTQNI